MGMGEAATTVQCVGSAEAPQARSHEKSEALPPEFSDALRFLKAKNMKRFPEQANNGLLCEMSKAFLLEINDRLYYGNTNYEVPDCVWEKIDRIDSNLPVPKSPPWVDRV